MAATSQPISIARDQRSSDLNNHILLNPPSLNHTSFAGSPMNTSSSFLTHPAHLANPRYAGASPRSAESSTSWSIHPGPLFVSAGSLGSTSGSISGSVGGLRNKMYPGLGCSPAPVLNPLDPEFKFRGVVGSMESDHGSLINAHMSEREVEQMRDFSCCGLPLNDLHAVVEHFESQHVDVVDRLASPVPFHPSLMMYAGDLQKGAGPSDGSAASSGPVSGSTILTSTDSSLAGALGPSSSAPLGSSSTELASRSGSAPAGFDLDDIDMEMDPEPEHEQATSPAPSASSNNSCSNTNSSSTRSSPLGGGAGPLPLTQPQRFANANGMPNGTRSSVSSPPDTPLLTTPVSPYATAPASQTAFPWSSSSQAQGDGLVGLASNIQSQAQTQHQVSAGPPAFNDVVLPAKHIHGGNGMFAHPYAGASSARRHATHPLSPLSSASTSAANSPATASSSSNFNQAQLRAGLHHTQSLYALRLARQHAEQRERDHEEYLKKAWNGYAGYEDYSRGFPGTAALDGTNVGITNSSSVFGTDAGGGAGGVGRMSVGPTETAIHPGLLFGSGNANSNGTNAGGVSNGIKTEPATALTTPAQSRSGSPSSSSPPFASASASGAPSSTLASTSTSVSTPGSSASLSNNGLLPRKNPASSTLSRHTSSLLLSKPFKCPTPGCTKSYKQANGLKYHVTHGQCSFTPPPELSSISELGLSIGVNLKIGPMGLEGLENMSEQERREAEKEAERRLRPFCCQVKPCTRRYKNMNGLRYHYQHSGEHGAIGLRMLASGRHDATREQSPERSDEEENGENGEQRNGVRDGEGNSQRAGSAERGRRRERKEGSGSGQTSSAPSTPGPSQAARNGPLSNHASAFGGFSQQTPLHLHLHHQRSLSGSSGPHQQPRSPLSQQFSPRISSSTTSTTCSTAGTTIPIQTQNGFAQPFAGLNGFNVSGILNGMNGMAGIVNGGQYAFAVQSQPASAYATPWGSRAASPTSMSNPASGQWGSSTASGQSQGQGQGQSGADV